MSQADLTHGEEEDENDDDDEGNRMPPPLSASSSSYLLREINLQMKRDTTTTPGIDNNRTSRQRLGVRNVRLSI